MFGRERLGQTQGGKRTSSLKQVSGGREASLCCPSASSWDSSGTQGLVPFGLPWRRAGGSGSLGAVGVADANRSGGGMCLLEERQEVVSPP